LQTKQACHQPVADWNARHALRHAHCRGTSPNTSADVRAAMTTIPKPPTVLTPSAATTASIEGNAWSCVQTCASGTPPQPTTTAPVAAVISFACAPHLVGLVLLLVGIARGCWLLGLVWPGLA
jgi:hypothetical protein